MKLCRFGHEAKDRRSFDDCVNSFAHDPIDPILTGRQSTEVRTEARKALQLPVELESPVVLAGSAVFGLVSRPDALVRKHPCGSISDIVQKVIDDLNIDRNALLAGNRARCFGSARRLILMIACRHLGYPVVEVARVLGIASSSASNLLNRRPHQCELLVSVAKRIADDLRTLA